MVSEAVDYDFAELLEVFGIDVVEGVEVVAVDIEHTDYIAVRVEHRHNNLGTREAAACDVTWELLYIGHHLSLAFLPCSAAYATTIGNLEAGGGALEGSEMEVAGFFAHEVEAYPEEWECFAYGSGCVGQDAYVVVFARDEGLEVGEELCVGFLFGHIIA